jgi:FkbM family methyltransferase
VRLNPTIVRIAAAPFIVYVRHFPVRRGKGVILRGLLAPLLSKLGEVRFDVPPRGSVRLSARETLGLHWLVYGPFEHPERDYAARAVARGGWAIDVGANVGVFSVTLAQALTGGGRLIAVEPLQDNLRRLQQNLAESGIDAVSLVAAAVGAEPGRARLWSAADTAYASLNADSAGRAAVGVEVEVTTLDRVWDAHGNPLVRFIKVDVEGAEIEALRGAQRLLKACRPDLLIEVDDAGRLAAMETLLDSLGYRRGQPAGFEPWNHLFIIDRGA